MKYVFLLANAIAGGANKSKLLVSDGACFTTMLSVGDEIERMVSHVFIIHYIKK